jgi:hypothetical protein
MDAMDKAIAEVKAVREHDEMMDKKMFAEIDAERHAIRAAMEEWVNLPEVGGNPSFMDDFAMAVSAAFAAGWIGGREYIKGRPK